MGRPITWQGENEMGEATVKGKARLIGSSLSVRNVRFRTEGQGSIELRDVQRIGRLEVREDGGRIKIEERKSSSVDGSR